MTNFEGWVLYDEPALVNELDNARDRKEKADKDIKAIELRLSDIKAEKKYGGDIR